MARDITKIIIHDIRGTTTPQKSMQDIFLSELGFGTTSTWTPNTDIMETEEKLIIRVEIPGVAPEQITLTLRDDALVLRGQRMEKEENSRVYYHQMELSYGPFEKVIILPRNLHGHDIEATYRQGILEIVIVKAGQVRTIEIESEE